MSVRRLADAVVQPGSFSFSEENFRWAQVKMAEYPLGRQQSAVIPLLWRAQEQEGWISRAAIETVANMLGMAYIRVLEVATFYTQFLLKPAGTRAHVQICGTTPCMLRGAEDLRAVCEHRISHEPLTTNEAGTLSWEEVECLGACVNAPMIMIGNDTYEDLTVERFEEILDAFEAGRGDSIKPGPQIERVTSAAEGGATTLLEQPTAERTYKPFPPPPTPAAAPGAAATPAAPKAEPAKADEPAPTTPGKKASVSEEAAPALKEPAAAPKVSEAKAEDERKNADAAANANGKPNRAMREDATGAESPAGKVNAGKAPNKKGPQRLFEAPAGPGDDLKKIGGIGPVLENALKDMGITTWEQVAKLTPEQVAAIEGELGFRGRAARDNWLPQADALARGGVGEHERVFGKKPR
ncbi:MAG TPA: NADH-quinone oxidoreductase subunit NuoE [Devosiaceae bacterium]|nr:NADH-quinone oxidoreductase subunit NuoE [Devosiaceae bacterium]